MRRRRALAFGEELGSPYSLVAACAGLGLGHRLRLCPPSCGSHTLCSGDNSGSDSNFFATPCPRYAACLPDGAVLWYAAIEWIGGPIVLRGVPGPCYISAIDMQRICPQLAGADMEMELFVWIVLCQAIIHSHGLPEACGIRAGVAIRKQGHHHHGRTPQIAAPRLPAPGAIVAKETGVYWWWLTDGSGFPHARFPAKLAPRPLVKV
jgi:hypothetical protein